MSIGRRVLRKQRSTFSENSPRLMRFGQGSVRGHTVVTTCCGDLRQINVRQAGWNGYKVVGVDRVDVCIEGVVSCGSVRWPSFGRAMVEELNELLEKLAFFEEESNRLFSFTRLSSNSKEEVNFVELREKVTLVKFGEVEDRIRILNLALWLFDQSIFSLTPQTVLEVGEAIGEVMAIDWRD
ncbi:hypothetical protein Gohar_010326, partial [Gossypium harknessii]|nr:hypothetical protein [Gossypium harknessii]